MTKQKISVGRTASLFVVSAPADEPFQKDLEKHLAGLKRRGFVSIASIHTLLAGTDRALTIEEQLKQSDIIVLLISADFLSSDELYLIMESAVQKKDEGPFAKCTAQLTFHEN
ncbi:MAG TPA: hypothetical protein VFV38_25930 [Ktedonobacteraceae bacterium]|nr:hypothetical protein [Ktedonobacteraceae bacterium]